MDEDTAVHVVSDRIVLTVMAVFLLEEHPGLANALRTGVDTALGKTVIGEDTPHPLKVKIRKEFMELIDHIEELEKGLRKRKPRTLRGRFFNWLKSGI